MVMRDPSTAIDGLIYSLLYFHQLDEIAKEAALSPKSSSSAQGEESFCSSILDSSSDDAVP